jgi:hypothetical protein
MAISAWPARWDALRHACDDRKAMGRWAEGKGKPPRFDIGPPATERDVNQMETELGCAIPPSLRKVFLEFSAATRIEWALPEGTVMPEPFRTIYSGECRWDLNSLPGLLETYRGWLKVFADPTDFWDGPWQNKFPVLEVGNGDMLAIDLGELQPVVYLSHEGDDSVHGYWLGRDFEDYVDRLSLLGCVGSEDWQLKPFVSGPRSLLETDGANARHWREWFGLRLPGDA